MKVRYTLRARADLEEIVQYVALENAVAATRVRLAIADAVELIAAFPYAGIKNSRVRRN